MSKLGFEPSEADPCLFLHRELQIMVLNYCDNQIWLSPDNQLIEKYVQSLKDLGYDLELEPKGDIFGVLGIEFSTDPTTGMTKLSQARLIDKVTVSNAPR